ncbi:DUF3526 domain-containing protein [Agaribacterium sp. ZY112]|uniref:DUF3526 domain-containing protein n=1 Tax=Agaribacterium sp. ZY112 TaxID=3233574 RepID=UPI003525176D
MRQILLIAAGEWRYWLRSYFALAGVLVFLLLIVTSSILTAFRIDAETHTRVEQQQESEQTFLEQPDRHPHRMVHYGHYIFRAPAPLAIFDPGLDSVTGQSIFLEGHRQNTTMFAESSVSADFGGLSAVSPALIYQLFAPLIIILLGHAALVRERESAALSPLLSLGVSGPRLILGKVLALFSFILILLLPLLVSGALTLVRGEDPRSVLLLFTVYLVYLLLWGLMTLWLSTISAKRSTALAVLAGLWFMWSLVLPSIAVNIASSTLPLAGKIETDLAMLNEKRKLGDGHNANDPAFKQLRADLLEKYGVQQVEKLPINFRGLVAMEAEQKLTNMLNEYAQARMERESEQEKLIGNYAWLTPMLAISFVSRAIAGTDLEHYHRFQKEAEALRFSFVQGLNQAHMQELSYQDDINRNKDQASWLRARVDASSWQVLDRYQFKTAVFTERFSHIKAPMQVLLIWLFLMLMVLLYSARSLKP